jgi:hypothetical protein
MPATRSPWQRKPDRRKVGGMNFRANSVSRNDWSFRFDVGPRVQQNVRDPIAGRIPIVSTNGLNTRLH